MNCMGLSSELRKTSRSIVCNIAEGHKRWSTREYIHFLRISAGSAAELESQIMLANRLGYFRDDAALTDFRNAVRNCQNARCPNPKPWSSASTPTPNPSTPLTPLPLYPFAPLILPDRGYSRMRSLPTRRVNFSRSRYSSNGMACLRLKSKTSLNSATPNFAPGANLAFICFLMVSRVVR